jgi:hypothetical protein
MYVHVSITYIGIWHPSTVGNEWFDIWIHEGSTCQNCRFLMSFVCVCAVHNLNTVWGVPPPVSQAIGTAATPGLLCQPQVIMRMIVEKQLECRLSGETEVLGENLPHRHFVHHKIPRDQARIWSRRLTAWAMVPPQFEVTVFWYVILHSLDRKMHTFWRNTLLKRGGRRFLSNVCSFLQYYVATHHRRQ